MDPFAYPQGALGILAGRIMAAQNGDVERWAAALMPATGSVLEIGCGPGVALQALGPRAVGVDISRPMVVEARKRAPGSHIVQADAAALPFADGSFGAAMAVHCLALLPPQGLAELRRVLAAGAPMVGVHREVRQGGPEPRALVDALHAARFDGVSSKHESGRLVLRARA